MSIRKDIDTGSFKFPQGFPLELRLKDMLEDEVDERYYLDDKHIQTFNLHAERERKKGKNEIFSINTRISLSTYFSTSSVILFHEDCFEADRI